MMSFIHQASSSDLRCSDALVGSSSKTSQPYEALGRGPNGSTWERHNGLAGSADRQARQGKANELPMLSWSVL